MANHKGANPYTLAFGKAPTELISRFRPQREVLETFTAPSPSQQIYVITGVRGMGKTVFLTEMAEDFRKLENWVVVELNPNRDLLSSLAGKLSDQDALAMMFANAKIDLSFLGFGVSIKGAKPIVDIETALERMLESMRRHGKRLLMLIDEVSNSKEMREFASSFQIFIRQDLPVFLLATGLYENVRELQDEDNLTFLYRAPKIGLGPLNTGAIVSNYERTFGLEREQALEMAELTNGYSFAFQALGYLTWEAGGDYRSVVGDYRQHLEEYVYEKIWAELSGKDREVLRAMALTPGGRVKDVRERLGMESNQFAPYRKRLVSKGIVDGETRGIVRFVLPLFGEFALENEA